MSRVLPWVLVLVLPALAIPGVLQALAAEPTGAALVQPTAPSGPAPPAVEVASGDACGGVEGEPNANAGCLLPLARGINVDVWLRYGLPNEDVQPSDLERMRELGFTYVRLPVTPEPYEKDGRLDPAAMAKLDEKLDQVLAAGLGAIVDLHGSDAYVHPVLRGGKAQDDHVLFVEEFARALSRRDPTMVAFEMMNEPHDPDPADGIAYDHDPLQRRLWEAARRGAPEMTLVATGADWSSIEGLEAMDVLPDENVIYDVHVYSPFLFTHQGATWTWDVVEDLRGVPYGSTPENVAPVVATLPDHVASHVSWYGKERWNKAKLAEVYDRIARWRDEQGVRVWVGEFGAFAPYAPADDRARWIDDARELAEERGMPWAMWEWDRRFGLYDRGTGEVDPAVADALGLSLR